MTKLIATGSLGVLGSLLFVPFVVLSQIFQMPGLFIMTSAFIIPAILTPFLFVIDQFGAAAIGTTVLAIITFPTNLTGPPGFLPKILLGPATGILIDLLYLILKRKETLAAFLIGIGAIFIQEVFFVAMLRIFLIPGWKESLKFMFSPLGIGFVLFHGILGGIIGLAILRRIRNTAIVKRIQS